MQPQYTEKTFSLGAMNGLSEKQITEHLKLYTGYVKNVNSLLEKTGDLKKSEAENAYVLAELRRRLGFEFNGMRLHEYYFDGLGGDGSLNTKGSLGVALTERYGSLEAWREHVTTLGKMRGIGWVITYYDPVIKTFHTAWVGDHDIGHLGGLPIISALDVWEHAFLLDYLPSERGQYIEAYFNNLRWSALEERFASAQ